MIESLRHGAVARSAIIKVTAWLEAKDLAAKAARATR